MMSVGVTLNRNDQELECIFSDALASLFHKDDILLFPQMPTSVLHMSDEVIMGLMVQAQL